MYWCLVLRNTIEHPKGMDAGTLNTNRNRRRYNFQCNKRMNNKSDEYEEMSIANHPYEGGQASEK